MLYKKLIEEHLNTIKPILSDTKREYTYGMLHEESMAFAAQIQDKGIKEGDHVFIINDDSIECVIAILACILSGAVFIVIPDSTTEKQLQFMIKDSIPKLICHNKQRKDVDKFGVTEITFNLDQNKAYMKDKRNRTIIKNDAVCYILYTSGSTKEPKGVIACQRQVLFCIQAIQRVLKNDHNDKILSCLPLSFDFGLYQIFLSLMFESKVILLKKYIIPQLPVYLSKFQITIFPVVPTIATLLLKSGELKKYKLPYLRQINSTGDVFGLSIIKKFMEMFPEIQILPMYGLTECKRVAIMPEGCEEKVLKGSCGYPLPGVTVYLVNKDKDGVGELMVEGENVMEGYWGCVNQEENGFGYNEKTGKRTLRTGDLFQIDNDGFLYYKGRIKNIIKSKGYRISSAELESSLSEIETFIEVKVIGIPDDLIGEKIAVFVYTKDPLVKEKIEKHCMDWIHYHRPHILIISQKPLPTNTNGKLDKLALITLKDENKDLKVIHLR